MIKWLGLIGTILVPFLIFYLGQENPDVVYTLSDNIPVNASANSNIQQIEVKNIGDSSATDIQIKIDEKITNSEVIKDSESDKIKTYEGDNYELVYPELPPEGSFKLIFESNLNELNKNVLTIKSKDGLARNGLEDNNKSSWITLFIPYFIYTILILYYFREITINHKIRKLMLFGTDNIDLIYKKKPFYMSDKHWVQLLKNFITKKLNDDLELSYVFKADELNSFIIIKSKKPNFFNEESWRKTTNEAVKVLKTKIQQSILVAYEEEKILTFYSSIFESLDNFPDDIRLEIYDKISKSFIGFKRNEYHITLDDINKSINAKKPSFVKEEDWEKYINYLGKLQHMYLLEEMYKSFNQPLEIYKKYEDNIFQRSSVFFRSKDSLQKIAYNIEFYNFISNTLEYRNLKASNIPIKPKWMKEEHYNSFKEITEKITSIGDKQKEISEQVDIISDALFSKKLPEKKPGQMNEYQWEILNDFVTHRKEINDLKVKIEQREIEVNDKEKDISEQQEDVNKLKEKIERQLNIINHIFTDPDSIYRIETYNNPFATGNFENLKSLAEQLKK